MPPKKGNAKAKTELISSKSVEEDAKGKQLAAGTSEDVKPAAPAESLSDHGKVPDEQLSKKRKNGVNAEDPQKAPRRSGRSAPKSMPSQEKLLRYMLSTGAEELCRPEDETEDINQRGNIRTYSSSVLNPFEELLCAVILSRPISHRLGLRTIRTVLNEPYHFTSAKVTMDAGSEKQHQALWDARTQHKQKTAEQIGHLAEVVMCKFTSDNDKEGTQMQKVRDDCKHDVQKEREYLQASVKGLGRTGLDIFFRRVQWIWDDGYPLVDDRTMQSLRKLGLPEDGDELRQVMQLHWGKLETEDLAGDDEAMKKRRAFVTILERATGSDLEGKHEALLEAAANA